MRTILSLALAAIVMTGCGKPQNPDAAASVRPIRVAICPTSPPNCFQDGSAYTGIDLDIFRAFCEQRGVPFEMTPYDWVGMLGAITSGRADVAFSGISITEKRKEVMEFSNAYMVNSLVIAALTGKGVAITSPADWQKYRLGSVRGMYFSDLIKTTYRDVYDYSALRQYPSYNELLADLGNGKIDGAFMDSLVLADQMHKGIYPLETAYTLEESDQFGFAFPKGSALRDDFNRYLQDNADGIQAILRRYLEN